MSKQADRDLTIAAQCWCDPTTSHLEMIPELAIVFAKAIAQVRREERETVKLEVCNDCRAKL